MIDWAASAAPLLVWLLATEATAREAALELPFIRQPHRATVGVFTSLTSCRNRFRVGIICRSSST
jgi:hypothetical protein